MFHQELDRLPNARGDHVARVRQEDCAPLLLSELHVLVRVWFGFFDLDFAQSPCKLYISRMDIRV